MFTWNHLIVSSILIAVIVGIRFLFGGHMPQRAKYALWLLVAVKLLVPLPIENVFNLTNFLPDEIQRTAMADGGTGNVPVGGILRSADAGAGSGMMGADGAAGSASGEWEGTDRSAAQKGQTGGSLAVMDGSESGRRAIEESSGMAGVSDGSGMEGTAGASDGSGMEGTAGASDGYGMKGTAGASDGSGMKGTAGASDLSGMGDTKNASDKSGADDMSDRVPESAGLTKGNRGIVGDVLYSVFYGIWLTGAILLGTVLFINNLAFFARLKKNRTEFVQKSYGSGRKYAGKLPVYRTAEVDSPCLFGLFRPAIYLPQEWDRYCEYEEYILIHEWIHYRHGDVFWSLLRCVCLVLYWFNPLVWAAFNLSVRDSELACDEGVIAEIGQEARKSYGSMLLDLCEDFGFSEKWKIPVITTEMIGGRKEMRDRITELTRTNRRSVAAVAATLLVAALAVGCTYGNSSRTTESSGGASGAAVSSASVAGIDAEEKENQASGSSVAVANFDPGDAHVSQSDYYTTHSEEEIAADRKKQVELIQKSSDVWWNPSLYDSEKGEKGTINGKKVFVNEAVDKYMITDLDQNGRLEIIQSYLHTDSFYSSTLVAAGQEKFFEVNENRDGLVECHMEGEIAPRFSWTTDIEEARAYFDTETAVWNYRILGIKKDQPVTESGVEEWQLSYANLKKQGDIIYVTADEESLKFYDEENGEQVYREKYEGAVRGTATFSWFQTVYLKDNYPFPTDEPFSAKFIKHWTSGELHKVLDLSARGFSVKKEEKPDFDYEKIYRDYASFLQAIDSSKKKWYMAIVQSDQPVLLMTDSVMKQGSGKDKTFTAVSADVYGYSKEKGEVVKIGEIKSTGSGYPILASARYILTGFHHSSDRLCVENGVGIIERVEGFGMESGEGKYSRIQMTNGKQRVLEEIEIPRKLAETLDYYSGWGGGFMGEGLEEVKFEKVK